MFPPAAGGAATEAWAQLLGTSSTSGTDAIFEVNAVTGLLTMAVRVGFVDGGAVSIAYDSTNHAWLRIREDSGRSEEHTSELQSLMRISYAVFCLKKKKHKRKQMSNTTNTLDNKHDRNIQKTNN